MASLTETIKQRILKFEGVNRLDESPNSVRLTYINSDEEVKRQHLQEYKVWYVGDSDELLNYYLNREISGNAKEPFYNRNKKQYFWGLSEKECSIKRVHTGIPRASIITFCNIIGQPEITSKSHQDKLDLIIKKNHFYQLLTQEARPLTLAEGWGSYKPTFDKRYSNVPIIQYYEAEDCEFVVKNRMLIGIIYKDYYNYQGKEYVLLEVRRTANGNSYIEFELYRLMKSNEVEPVALNTIPELGNLPDDGYCFEGINHPMGVASKYLYDVLNKDYGMSILAGRIDVADDMDMLASVESLTEKCSGPVEYYPVDLLKRDKNGKPGLPIVFGRTYVKKPTAPDANGGEDSTIDTSAPVLDFAKYSDALVHKMEMFISGWLSPASFGINLAKQDNAMAQREKEKVTIFSRNNVMDAETEQNKQLMAICLELLEFMETGGISLVDYCEDISIKYNEFAAPTMESMANILTPLALQGLMTPKMFVDKLYGDSLSDKEKMEQVLYIEEKQKEQISLDGMGIGQDLPAENPEQEFAAIPEE